MNIVDEIITKAGSQAEIARTLNVGVMTVSQWKNRGRIPSEWVLPVEELTGVPCWKIRPDLYPPERFKKVA